MRVLITGATGFVGGYLARHLLDVEPDVLIVGTHHPGTPAPPPPDPRVRFVDCDILARDGDDIGDLIEQVRPDLLYHLAGYASAASGERGAVFRANVDGTYNVLNAATHHRMAGRILAVSTGYIYGPCDPARPAREDDPLRPAGVYAESKAEAEKVIESDGRAITARAFNHTGPGQTDAFAIPAFARQIAAIERGQQPPRLRVGNLEARRDFLDVRDVVRAYHLLAERGTPGQVYNVCRGEAILMRDALDQLLSLSRVPIEVVPDPDRMRPSDLPVSVGDPAKLEALTGWQPQIPFSQTLRDTLDWWRQQP